MEMLAACKLGPVSQCSEDLIPKIPNDVLKAIVTLLVDLMEIMISRLEKDLERYMTALEKFKNPTDRERWPLLSAFGCQFILTLFDSRLKNRYEISTLQRSQFEQILEADILLWKVDQGGKSPLTIVYNLDEETGFNAGLYIETYLRILNPDNIFLFQKPKDAHNFDLHSMDEDIVYTHFIMDHHVIDRCLPVLCSTVGKAKYQNPSIWKTGQKFDPSTLFQNLPGMELFQCPYNPCEKNGNSFSNKFTVYDHIDNAHDTKANFSFRCLYKDCTENNLHSMTSVVSHINSDHPELKRVWEPDVATILSLQSKLTLMDPEPSSFKDDDKAYSSEEYVEPKTSNVEEEDYTCIKPFQEKRKET